jgi:hypothetical protein
VEQVEQAWSLAADERRQVEPGGSGPSGASTRRGDGGGRQARSGVGGAARGLMGRSAQRP